MKIIRPCLFISLLFALPGSGRAQSNIRDSSIAFTAIGATFAYQLPSADMKKRFGNNFNIGGVLQYKTKKNLIIGLDGQFFFSENVRDKSFLDPFSTADGYLISGDGSLVKPVISERGWKFEIKAGKIIPSFGPNPNCGILLTAGAGILQHKILIENHRENIPFLRDEYLKGYDQLSNGLQFTEFIGYAYFSNKRMVNFYAGFEFTQAFTRNRRTFNFYTRSADNTLRKDFLNGIRVGWVIPVYRRSSNQFYYN